MLELLPGGTPTPNSEVDLEEVLGGSCSFVVAGLLAFGLAACGGEVPAAAQDPPKQARAAVRAEGGNEGGTLKGAYASFPDYMDPEISYTAEGWTAMRPVYVPLITYKHAAGAEGAEIIPGLAKEMPKVTNGGKTYTLFLKPGLKYSNGEPIKAGDFKWAVERVFLTNSGGSSFYTDIVGAEQFQKTKKGGISGIKTNEKTGEIVINLKKPRGTFNNELALKFVAPVPQNTPEEDQSASPPPASGPYMITKSEPGRGWDYERNPTGPKTTANKSKSRPATSTRSKSKSTATSRPRSTTSNRANSTGSSIRPRPTVTRKSRKNSKAPSSSWSRRSPRTTSG